jgi:glycosyltransferase involved in cell wall biosynthesis
MSRQPVFSVVVPTFNRPAQLASLLDALARLSYPAQDWELIVVDDGGDVPLDDLLAPHRERFVATLLRQQNTGPAGARNNGVARACGEYLAFIDDDGEPASDWLDAFERVLRASPAALCGGRTVNRLADNPYAEASQLLLDHLNQCYRPGEHLGAFFPTNNMVLAREQFVRLGGFDRTMRFGEDREFCYRWAVTGGPFQFVPEAVVHHSHPLEWQSFLQLHFLYGGGTREFRRRTRAGGGPQVAISSPGWYLNLILAGLRKERSLRGMRLSALLAAAQGSMAAGLVWRALKNGH